MSWKDIEKNGTWQGIRRVRTLSQLVIDGKKPLQMFCSDAGLGKSETVLETFADNKLKPHYSSPDFDPGSLRRSVAPSRQHLLLGRLRPRLPRRKNPEPPEDGARPATVGGRAVEPPDSKRTKTGGCKATRRTTRMCRHPPFPSAPSTGCSQERIRITLIRTSFPPLSVATSPRLSAAVSTRCGYHLIRSPSSIIQSG